MLESQRHGKDMRGLVFEQGESSESGQSNAKPKKRKNPPVRQPNAHKFNGRYFTWNKFGHMVNQCKSRMNNGMNNMNNGPTFTGQCFICNNFGHKSNMCKAVMKNFQNKIFYACGMFGHISNQCRMRPNPMNSRPIKNVVCHACNKTDHIAKYYRRKNNALVNKDKSNDKGKAKVEEIIDKHEKMWVRKDESKVDNGSAPESGVGSSSRN